MRALVAYFLHRSIFVNLLTVIVIGVGAYVAATMNREVFPNIDFEIVIITTVYPGASPQEVEKLVTIPIEETLQEVDGIKEYRSSSIEGRSTITVRIDSDVDDGQKVVDDVRSAVDRTDDLPLEIEKPVLSQINTVQYPVIQWAVSAKTGPGETVDYNALRAYAGRLETEFLAMDAVARVDRRGWLNREIYVEVNPTAMNRYYLDAASVTRSLGVRNINLPGGDINVGNREIIVRTVGEFETADEISRLHVRSNDAGENVQLRDFARVTEGFEEPQYLESTDNARSIGLTVIKRQSADILGTVRDTRRIVLDFATRELILRVPCAGCSGEDAAQTIGEPLRKWIEANLSAPTGMFWFRREGRVRSVQPGEPEAGRAEVRIRLNPDYIYDSELKRPELVFAAMDADLRGEIAAALKTGAVKLPAGAGPIEMESRSGPEDVSITDFNDISYIVQTRLGVLIGNGLTGLLLVLITLFLFMGWRTAVMVALGIPVAFGIAFIGLSYMGMTLNMVSMLSLVIVVGIVVDDAIIVSENIYRYVEEGMDYYEAAAQGTTEVIAPVMATVTTTIAAFAPMLYVSGIFGKFVFTIPVVIILVLVASTLECIFILPSHVYDMNRLFPGGGPAQEGGRWFIVLRDRFYRPALNWVLNRRWIFVTGLIVLLGVTGLIQAKFGKFKLFPTAVDSIYIKVELESGASKEETERYLYEIGRDVAELPDTELDTFVSRSGIQKIEGNDPYQKRGSNYGMLLVYLHPSTERTWTSERVIEFLRRRTEWMLTPEAIRRKRAGDQQEILSLLETGKFAQAVHAMIALDARSGADYAGDPARALAPDRELAGGLHALEIQKMAGGPPVGKDIAVEITGQRLDELEKIAEEFKALLAQVKGVEDVDDDFLEGKQEIRLRINEERASRAGLSVFQIAQAVNTAYQGAVATSIKRPDEEVDIRVRFSDEYRNDPSSLNQISVSNALGNLVAVNSMASFERATGTTVINHIDGKRLITVTANVDEAVSTAVAATASIRELARDLPGRYPGYKIVFSGQNKDTQESLRSLGRAFGVAVLVIFMILASLFRSLVMPAIVLMSIPFALIGVVLAFFFHGEPMSFMAVLGIIGLAGVVVNDSIVLVDFANSIREARPELSNREVALEAGVMRLRAVILTSVTTVAGLLPTAYGIGGYDPFIVPMALAFAWGLLFATILTLGLIPILYSQVLDCKDLVRRRMARARSA